MKKMKNSNSPQTPAPRINFPTDAGTSDATNLKSFCRVGNAVCNLGNTFRYAIQGVMRSAQAKTALFAPLLLISCSPILNKI
jgi:hypothetical protein